MVLKQTPHVVIFTNHYPPYKALSKDRWRVFELVKQEKEDDWIAEERDLSLCAPDMRRTEKEESPDVLNQLSTILKQLTK